MLVGHSHQKQGRFTVMPNQASDLYPRPLRHLSSYLSGLVQGKLWLKVLIGMFLGLITGTLLGPSVGLVKPETGTLIGNWLAFPGNCSWLPSR